MLNSLSVRNFQSLKKVDLELGQFTVIVGPSSSGKSALIRACKALASNVRGSGVITRGQKMAAITAVCDNHQITLERTDAASAYRLRHQGSEMSFTKLAGAVPEHITKALRIDPVPTSGTNVNFASQFDRPFLLDDTGANVARTLGELTNVSTIFAAVRAANKVRSSAASTLKTRKNDLSDIKATLAGFQGLGDRLIALGRAEELSAQAQTVQANITALERAQAKVRLAELTLAAAQRLPQVPDSAPMHTAYARLTALAEVLGKVNALRITAEKAVFNARRKTEVAEAFQHHLTETLKEAGVCPTCGQSTI